MYAARGEFIAAQGHLELAVKLSPQDATIHYSLGAVMAAQGRVNEAVKLLTEAIRLRPDDPEAKELLDRLTAAGS